MATALNDISKHKFYDHQKDSQPPQSVNEPYLSPARLQNTMIAKPHFKRSRPGPRSY